MEDIAEQKYEPSPEKNEKPKKLKIKNSGDIDGDHRVTFTVTIAKAFQTIEDEPKPNLKGLGGLKGKRRVFEAPKPHNYYHLEYKLMPDDAETMKTDVVTYGVAAKIYMESDSKILKTWKDGNKTWIAWTHSHTLVITQEILLKMFNHTLELKIWDMKDKVSPRARFDRPKAFRLPAGGDDDEDGGVRSLVMRQSVAYNNLQPKPSVLLPGDVEEKRYSKTAPGTFQTDRKCESKESEHSRAITAPSTFRSTSFSSETPTTLGMHSLVKVQVRVDDQQTPQFGRLATLAGVTPPMTQEAVRDLESSRISKIRVDESASRKRVRSRITPDDLHERSSKAKKAGGKSQAKREQAAAAAAQIRANGTASLAIKMSLFFSGMKSMTTRLEKAAGQIQDLYLSVALDKQLLSQSQKQELNPMVIKVCSASSMPNKPLNFKQLSEKCQPVRVQYNFFKEPTHNSRGRDHGREVYWQDTNVVLLGTIDKEVLAEYLRGPPLEIEVHDRDRKAEDKKTKPVLFGENPEDEMINNVALIAGRRTTHNPFEGRGKTWDPYGIARFDLSGLLVGQKMLQLRSPIQSCPIPEINIGHEKQDGPIVGQLGNVDGPEDSPNPAANYLEAGSELKIKVELAYPINASTQDKTSITERTTSECPFGRIVYIFEYSNAKFLRQLQNQVTDINAEALELGTLPQHVIEAALSTYKLSEEQRKNKTLDIITGFQVLDGQFHIFVLEGLADHGVKKLWGSLTRPEEPDSLKFNVLYNSEMRFSNRLYAPLDVDLCRVRLHEPLTVIVQNPLLYVRDLVPRPCFDALSKLDKMLRVTKLREATRSDLFPSADMVISMSREFGVPLTAEDFGELESEAPNDDEAGSGTRLTIPGPKTSRPWMHIQTHNVNYEETLKKREAVASEEKRDFIMENILKTRTVPRERPHTIAVDTSELHNQTSHNYSIQTLNSTELAREKLRQILAKEKERRFTYCPKYHSATVLPVDPDSVKKASQLESVRNWRTADGFIYPGKKTSLASNVHPKKPNSARADELNKPWKENILHSNILKPTVDRDIFTWPYRDRDLNLITKPPPFFDPNVVLSVHSAGDTKEEEMRRAQEQEANWWRTRVVVDDPIFRTHRCLTETEMRDSGPKASNQLAKLTGLLKDAGKKITFTKPGLSLSGVPPLSVVMNPSVDTLARDTGKLELQDSDFKNEKNCGFNPGPFEDKGWLLEKNKIPILDPEHRKYESLKGKDFRVYFRNNEMLYRRPIQPLTTEDRDNHLFAVAKPCS
ncbi:uncharacterized protein LOC5503934 [Nematostella vectensis]|uniref:uncharacterized protein LOC5503934 n=1 Tax=Nematostella vectensis TaxID=45351 RepID=UPI0020777193|nr:uncharacterized protein LOC5503934 [Nematostella vectensis]